MQVGGRADLVHGLAIQADEEGKGVVVLFNSEVDRRGARGAVTTGLEAAGFLHVAVLFRPEGQMDQTAAVQRGHDLLGVVVEILAEDEDGLAVDRATLGIREADVGGERNVAGDFIPDVAKLVAVVPDVVARRIQGVLFLRRIVARAARQERAADDPTGRRTGRSGCQN